MEPDGAAHVAVVGDRGVGGAQGVGSHSVRSAGLAMEAASAFRNRGHVQALLAKMMRCVVYEDCFLF